MIQNKMRVAVAFAACFYSAIVSSAETWIHCDQCAYSQAQELAIAMGPDQSVMVYSPRLGSGLNFWTYTEVIGENCHINRPGAGERNGSSETNTRAVGCQNVTRANGTALTAQQDAFISLVKDAHVETGGTMKSAIIVAADTIPGAPTTGGPVTTDPNGSTAYDVFNNYDVQVEMSDALVNYIKSRQDAMAKVVTFLTNMIDVQLLGAEFVIEVEVTFSDGSKLKYKIDSDVEEAQLLEAKDFKGRPIMAPEATDLVRYTGDSIFPTDRAAINWLENAVLAGATVEYGSGSRIGEKVSCRWDGEELICKQH